MSAAGITAPTMTLLILVRHAERADRSALMDPSVDPGLSKTGCARASRLASTLKDAGIGAIYTTSFTRTKQTAAPLARQLGITPVAVEGYDEEALLLRLRRERADTVLVVGHVDTLPSLVARLGGPAIYMDPSDYGSIFVLAPQSRAITRLRY